MKKQWLEPKIVEISAKMTEVPAKTGGTGDSSFPGIPLNDWQECNCCS